MKTGRIFFTVILCLLLIIGWGTNGVIIANRVSGVQQFAKQGNQYNQKGLYQKAALSYEDALEIREKKQIRDEWVDAYEKGFADEVFSSAEYKSALVTACSIYPKEAAYWEKLIERQLEMNDYKGAYNSYNKSVRNGAKSEKLSELGKDICYAYTIDKINYSEIWRSPAGNYTRLDDMGYSMTGTDGKPLYEEYLYISPVNDNGDGVFTTEKDSRWIDGNTIVQSIIPEQIADVETRASGDQILPVMNDAFCWRYLNCETGEYLKGEYDDASSFTDGIAAVMVNDQWEFVDKDLNRMGKTAFDDIKLYSNGEYTAYGYMVASEGGSYNIYNAMGERVCELNAADADVCFGELVAYRDKDGLWGYANLKGETVIAPQYKEARSFSSGLGAVYDGKSWGFINENGTVVIDYQYDDVDYFNKKGICYVSEKAGLYNQITLRFPRG